MNVPRGNKCALLCYSASPFCAFIQYTGSGMCLLPFVLPCVCAQSRITVQCVFSTVYLFIVPRPYFDRKICYFCYSKKKKKREWKKKLVVAARRADNLKLYIRVRWLVHAFFTIQIHPSPLVSLSTHAYKGALEKIEILPNFSFNPFTYFRIH